MKNIFYVFLTLFCINSNAQQIRAFAGLSAYLDSELKKSAFIEAGGGIEVKINRFIKPEVGISYFFGEFQDGINKDNQGNAIDVLSNRVSALNFSLTPKICLCSTEFSAGDVFFQILPRYNISKVQVDRTFTVINQSNPSNSVSKKQTASEWQHSLGIGVGIDIILSDENYDSLAINLYYNGVDMGKLVTDLSQNNTKYSTNNTLGLGLNYYFGFKKKKD